MLTSSRSPTQPEASPYARHIPALDGVRGLAILSVMGSHFFVGTPSSRIISALSNVLAFGSTGVDLFFALSGFLITGILFDSLHETHFFRKFYARRALRIFPLYYGVLIVCLIVGLVSHRHYMRELLSLAVYLQNTYLIAPPIYNFHALPLTHFWSLAIEEQFYLVWPVVVFAVRKRERLLWIALASFLVAPALRFGLLYHGWRLVYVHSLMLPRADSLLFGGALALLLRGPAHDRALRLTPWLIPIGTIPLVALILREYYSKLSLAEASLHFAYFSTGLAAVYTGLIALSLKPGVPSRVFSLAPLRALGKYSYGLYVFHLILWDFLSLHLRHLLDTHVTHSKPLGVALNGFLMFALSFGVAYLSFHLYEKHFLRLKKYFDYRPHPDTVQ